MSKFFIFSKRNRLLFIFIHLTFFASSQKSQDFIAEYCKVWGVCKYFSNTNSNWDEVVFAEYEKIVGIKNKSDFNRQIERLLKETDGITSNTDTVITRSEILEAWKIKDTTTYFLRINWEWVSNSKLINSSNKKKIIQLIVSYKKRKPSTVSFAGEGLVDHSKERTYNTFNKKIALLTLFRVYNVIEYYYPYKHLLDTAWGDVLKKMLPEFLVCQDYEDYLNAVKKLSAYIQDSHVWVKTTDFTKKSSQMVKLKYPIDLDFVKNELFISNILNDSIAECYHISKGDEVIKVNGLTVNEWLNVVARENACSNQQAVKNFLIKEILTTDSLTLLLKHNEQEKKVTIPKIPFSYNDYVRFIKYYTRPQTKDIGGIGYINMPKSTYFSIDNFFRQHKKSKAVVLDCRGYGTFGSLKTPKLLSKRPKQVVLLYKPAKNMPGVFQKQTETYYFSNSIDIIGKMLFHYTKKIFPTCNNPYKGLVVVLINEEAISFGETVIMMIKAYAENVVLIGRPTAGANGTVVELQLPLGETLFFSGVDFRFPNGEQLQRTGIQPDIFVEKQKEDILSERDTVLQTALEYIDKVIASENEQR